MQCPKCQLVNPPSTSTCDCGYSFEKGTYVGRPSERSTGTRVASARSRYSALEIVSTVYRVTAWLGAAVLVMLGIVLLLNTTDQQKTFAIPAALACFIYAAVAWLTCMVMAEGITLFIDI